MRGDSVLPVFCFEAVSPQYQSEPPSQTRSVQNIQNSFLKLIFSVIKLLHLTDMHVRELVVYNSTCIEKFVSFGVNNTIFHRNTEQGSKHLNKDKKVFSC